MTHTLKDLKHAHAIKVYFESGNYDLFERFSKDEWIHKHWDSENVYEEFYLNTEQVLNEYVNKHPAKIKIINSHQGTR